MNLLLKSVTKSVFKFSWNKRKQNQVASRIWQASFSSAMQYYMNVSKQPQPS